MAPQMYFVHSTSPDALWIERRAQRKKAAEAVKPPPKPSLHLTKYVLGLKNAREIRRELIAAYPPLPPPASQGKAAAAKDDKDNDKPKDAPKDTQPPTFTPEQDAAIMKMKGEDKTWRDISDAVGKTRSECTARFKELSAAAAKKAAEEDKKDGDKAEGKEKKGDDKDKDKDKGRRVKFDMVPDKNFAEADLKILKRVAVKDNEQLWDRLADKFYDETDRRISTDDLKKKFGVDEA